MHVNSEPTIQLIMIILQLNISMINHQEQTLINNPSQNIKIQKLKHQKFIQPDQLAIHDISLNYRHINMHNQQKRQQLKYGKHRRNQNIHLQISKEKSDKNIQNEQNIIIESMMRDSNYYGKVQNIGCIKMEKTVCPYNKSHTFAEEKYFWHINRCKDRLKVMHLYAACSFNSLHIVLKEDIEGHQCICPDRQAIMESRRKLKLVLEKCFANKKQKSMLMPVRQKIIQEESEANTYDQITSEMDTKTKKQEEQEQKNVDNEINKEIQQQCTKIMQQCQECTQNLNILQQILSNDRYELCRNHVKQVKKMIKMYRKIERI